MNISTDKEFPQFITGESIDKKSGGTNKYNAVLNRPAEIINVERTAQGVIIRKIALPKFRGK